jgi:polyhydroxybutyrate depolymerase
MRAFPGLTSLLAALGLLWAAPAGACPGADAPCRVADGEYFIRLPETGRTVGRPALMVHLHGAGGQAADVVRGAGFLDVFLGRGYAVLAPQGLAREGGRGPNWGVSDGRPHPRDDLAFIGEVIDDAVGRFDLDRTRVLLTGFSRGGSLVWDIACQAPAMASAYAPIAGGFWRPHPASCKGPVRLLHTHGFTDGTVPLEGRPLRGGAVAQGDIYEGLQLWRRTNGCGDRADWHDTSGPFWRKAWTACAAGTLEFALHPGGHGVPEGWGPMVIDWYERGPPPQD